MLSVLREESLDQASLILVLFGCNVTAEGMPVPFHLGEVLPAQLAYAGAESGAAGNAAGLLPIDDCDCSDGAVLSVAHG